MDELLTQELPYGVYLRTSDNNWTLKAAFMTPSMAAGYTVGLTMAKIPSKIYRMEHGIPAQEVTETALRELEEATRNR